MRDIGKVDFERLLVLADNALLLARRNRNRNDFRRKTAVLVGSPRLVERAHRKVVHLRARDLQLLRRLFGKNAHALLPFFLLSFWRIGIFQAVAQHVVEQPAVSHAQTPASVRQQVRSRTHALHTPGKNRRIPVRRKVAPQHLARHHHRLQTRAAHLVDRRRSHAVGQPRSPHRLARRCLSEPCGKDATDKSFRKKIRRSDPLPCNRLPPLAARQVLQASLNAARCQLRSGDGREVALKTADRRAARSNDDDRVFVIRNLAIRNLQHENRPSLTHFVYRGVRKRARKKTRGCGWN